MELFNSFLFGETIHHKSLGLTSNVKHRTAAGFNALSVQIFLDW